MKLFRFAEWLFVLSSMGWVVVRAFADLVLILAKLKLKE